MKNLLKILLSFVTLIAIIFGLIYQVNKMHNNNVDAKIELNLKVAETYYENENFEKAAIAYEKVLLEKDNLEVLSKLVTSYNNLEMYGNSLASINQMIRLDGEKEEHLLTKANVLTEIGLIEESLTILDAVKSTDAIALFIYSKNYFALNQTDEAIKYAKQALSANEKNEDIIILLADIYLANDRYQEAGNVLDEGYSLTNSSLILDKKESNALVFKNN